MALKSVNPFNNQELAEYEEFSKQTVSKIVDDVFDAWQIWRKKSFSVRAKYIREVANILRKGKSDFAKLITLEMGKRIIESEGEIEKCAWLCEFYAENAESMLSDELLTSDGVKSFAAFESIGPVLAVMPWNFPFWQALRFAVPAIMAGNTALLKHASNVQGCALAIEKIFIEAGFPVNVFRTLLIGSAKVEAVIANPKVRAVTLTGSEYAGSKVAQAAGKYLKKSVLELGGSDPFVVLHDADLSQAAKVGVQSRMLTSGQTCIAAKRFIVVKEVADLFLEKLMGELANYMPGNPLESETTLAPLAQRTFVDEVHQQVVDSAAMGAIIQAGGFLADNKSCFYPATLLSGVTPDMPVFYQETFGPVVALIVAKDEEEAVRLSNNSVFGLGAAIWTNNIERGEKIARKIEAGSVFINGLVKSDPRLPFGGIKNSGYGRELSHYGIKEFCNIKTVWIR